VVCTRFKLSETDALLKKQSETTGAVPSDL